MDNPERKICQKCGFDHNYPDSSLVAIQILVCVFSNDKNIEFVTSYGKVRPMTVIPLDKEEKENG